MKQYAAISDGSSSSSVYLTLILYSALIATSFPVGETVAHLISPTVLTCLRFVTASILFLSFLLLRGDLSFPSRELLAKCALPALSMSVFFSLMFESLKTASALNTGAIFTFSPLLALGFGLVINRVGASRQQVVALLIGAVGATWIVFDGKFDALLNFRLGYGEVVFLIGTICFSLYSPLVKRFLTNEDVAVATFWVLVFSALFTGAYSLFQDGVTGFHGVPAIAWGAIVYLALFPTAMSFFIAIRASAMISPFKVTSFVYLVPAIVALIDLVVFGRAVTVSIMLGIAVTAAATLIIQVSDPPERN